MALQHCRPTGLQHAGQRRSGQLALALTQAVLVGHAWQVGHRLCGRQPAGRRQLVAHAGGRPRPELSNGTRVVRLAAAAEGRQAGRRAGGCCRGSPAAGVNLGFQSSECRGYQTLRAGQGFRWLGVQPLGGLAAAALLSLALIVNFEMAPGGKGAWVPAWAKLPRCSKFRAPKPLAADCTLVCDHCHTLAHARRLQMEVNALPQPPLSPAPPSAKKVQFLEANLDAGALKASPDGKAAAAGAAGAACPELPLGSSHTNALFSPERPEGGWTISAQRADRMEEPEAAAGGEPLASPSPLPSIGAASGAAYTPASSTWLESARKVSDLQDRLVSLEAALKDMESKVGCGVRLSAQGALRGQVSGTDVGWTQTLNHHTCCVAASFLGLTTPAGGGTPGQEPAGEGAGHGGQDCAEALPGRQGAGPQAAAPNPAGALGSSL